MKRAVLVIAEKVFRDEEYQKPKDILETAGIEVTTASTTTDKAVGKLGLEVEPDILVGSIHVDDYDALVFVGGGGAEQYFDDPVAHSLAHQFHAAHKLVAAICIAPVILANAGLLRDRLATVYPDGEAALTAGGAQYTARAVEAVGNIVTANGPEAAEAFGRQLVEMLQ